MSYFTGVAFVVAASPLEACGFVDGLGKALGRAGLGFFLNDVGLGLGFALVDSLGCDAVLATAGCELFPVGISAHATEVARSITNTRATRTLN